MSERDTQFAGFAKLLMDEIIATFAENGITVEPSFGWKEEWEAAIARRAYDLVRHTIECTSHIDLDRLTSDEHTLRIPDLTTWQEAESE